MKNIKTWIIPMMLGVVALSACGGSSTTSGGSTSKPETTSTPGTSSQETSIAPAGDPTVINLFHYSGTGTKEKPTWLQQAATRFANAHTTTEYEPGKKGIKFNFSENKNLNYDTLSSDGNDIFVDEVRVDTYAYNSNMMDLTDVVKPLVDANKLDKDAILRSQNPNKPGQYFSLPHYEWFTGISYDIDLFEENNWYFADPTESAKVANPTTFGTVYLIGNSDAKKSVGPDGVRNTSDDGLPSSVMEFCALCDIIGETSKNTHPVVLAGSASQYSFYFVNALWASLAGVDAMKDIYANYTSKEVEVVTGYSDSEELFYTGSGIAKPITEKVVLNSDNGYKMYDMVERYYALSVFQLLAKKSEEINSFKQAWIKAGATTEDAKVAQDKFIINPTAKEQYAMLYDASYWFHEDIAFYNQYSKQKGPRNLSHMPLPTQFDGQVTEGNGKKQTLMDMGSTYIFANSRTAANEGKTKAVKEFLSFLYTNDELNKFSQLTGLTVPAVYDYSTEGSEPYYQNLAKLRSESNVVYYSSSDTRFIKHLGSFNISFGSSLCNVGGNQEGYYINCKNGYTGKDIFQATRMSKTTWDTLN